MFSINISKEVNTREGEELFKLKPSTGTRTKR